MSKKKVERRNKKANIILIELRIDDLAKEKIFTNIKKLKCDYTIYKE